MIKRKEKAKCLDFLEFLAANLLYAHLVLFDTQTIATKNQKRTMFPAT
jgi:hypothetical protein